MYTSSLFFCCCHFVIVTIKYNIFYYYACLVYLYERVNTSVPMLRWYCVSQSSIELDACQHQEPIMHEYLEGTVGVLQDLPSIIHLTSF